MAGKFAWGPELVGQLILLTATGHYFATFVRAYGDRDLFQRFRTRFLCAPVVLLATYIAMFASGNGPAAIVVTTGWAFWHWLAQAFGFARIYDIKAGSFSKRTALLDRALVISGFVGAVVLTDGATAEIATVFLNAGITLPNAEQFDMVQSTVLVAMIAVGIAYIVNLVMTILRGQPWSWQKQVMHVMTIGYYWFSFAWLPNVLVAYVLYEFFHDVQYYAITWLTCRHRVQRPGVTRWLGRMFQPGWLAAIGFLITMTAFGGIDVLGRSWLDSQDLSHQIWTGVILTLAVLHYYYDGFIWKARENTLGADLGIQNGIRTKVVPGLRHAAAWGAFFVPLLILTDYEGSDISSRNRAEALVALAPGDFLSQSELALNMAGSGEITSALEHYRTSIAINPHIAQTHVNYGSALECSGDVAAAQQQYEAALRCSAHGDAHTQAHFNLGVLLLIQGDSEQARRHLEANSQSTASDPVMRMMGLAQILPKDEQTQRLQIYSTVLKLDPEQLEARFNLATDCMTNRRYEEARKHFEFLVDRKPNVTSGIIGLASAQLELGLRQDARRTLQRALQLAPSDQAALRLKARIGR